jgi:hypothetical protein
LFYRVSIAIISDHREAILTRFRFDVYSPRYLYEQKVSDFRGVDNLMQKDNFMHYCISCEVIAGIVAKANLCEDGPVWR